MKLLRYPFGSLSKASSVSGSKFRKTTFPLPASFSPRSFRRVVLPDCLGPFMAKISRRLSHFQFREEFPWDHFRFFHGNISFVDIV